MAAPLSSTICPQCKVNGPVRLAAGQVCDACRAQNAWTRLETEGRLVIDHDDIDDALARREGEAARESPIVKALPFAPALVSVGASALSLRFLARLVGPRHIGPPSELIAGIQSASLRAFVAGLGAIVAAVAALVWLRRRRHFRNLVLLVPHLCAVVVGGAAMAIGGFHIAAVGGFGMEHLTMPARAPSAVPDPFADRIMDATAVISAPDANGDARASVIGTGAVIAGDDHRVWIVTCSHVAMPYASVASWRDVAHAQPVWVQLADGRNAIGRVRWTARPPLDVGLIELPIENPPKPIIISPDSGELVPGGAVMFVPNPFRNGWMVHRGAVLRRERHLTPAGEYSLLFTDLPVQPGDSGSGLFDSMGRLVGLNTWTLIDNAGPHGISLPSEAMRALVDAIHDNRLDQLDQAFPIPPEAGQVK